MAAPIFHQLREQMDQYSTGFPATESGVELKILERLFTEEDAEIYLDLSMMLESPADFAGRTNRPPEEAATKLESMAKRGLLFRHVKDGRKRWTRPLKINAEEILYLSSAAGAVYATYSWNSKDEETIGGRKTIRRVRYGILKIDARTSKDVWNVELKAGSHTYAHNMNNQHPVFLKDSIYLGFGEGGRHVGIAEVDIVSGAHEASHRAQVEKGCTLLTASAHNVFYRTGVIGTMDTRTGKTAHASSSTRPSCWISTLPAGGLVMMPESSLGCECTLPLRTSVVVAPKTRKE